MVEGPRKVLIIRESTRDTPEFGGLLVSLRNGEAEGYLKSRGHKLFTLDDNDSPMPTMKLSQAGAVEVVARVSRTGGANRAAGDLESAPLAAQPKPGAHYDVRIDQVVK